MGAPLLAYFVGSDGEFDWQFIKAASEAEAKAVWATGWSSGRCECERPPEDDEFEECEFCEYVNRADVNRVPQFDDRKSIKSGDWLRSGYGTPCSRCKEHTWLEEDGRVIGDVAVCDECMTLADWDVADPERAAEMRADLEDEPPASGTETAKADKTEGLGPKGDGPAPTTVGGRP